MKRVSRRSWWRSSRTLWIALPTLIVLLSFGGYLLTSESISSDRDAAAERRARAESVETQQILGRARAYVQGLSNVLASERRPGQARFATLATGTAASVGLDDLLWIEDVPGSARRRYERRVGAPISSLTPSGRFERAPPARAYLPATFTSKTRSELRRGADVSGFPGLADAVRDRATVFSVSASKAGSLGDEPGFYLLQSASFGRSRGYLAAFVPRGWFITTVGEDPRSMAISVDGRRLEGGLESANATADFDTLGRRWHIDVAREPPSSLQSTLPWLALAWPFAIAAIAFLVVRAVMLRRRAERETQEMFERSTDMIASGGFDGYFKRVNPALSRTLGYSADELMARPFTDFVHPEDLERTQAALAPVVAGEELIGFENRYLCADRSVRWIQWNIRPAVEERTMYGVGRDVTESRRAEREFEEIFNLSPDLIFIAGFDGYIKRANPACEKTFGYPAEELMSRPLPDFSYAEDADITRDALVSLTHGADVRFEARGLRADGSVVWLEWTARSLPEERLIYAAGRDVTERKRSEDELREARETVETSRAELAVYAADQVALRRVATQVAEDASPSDVLTAVVKEVGRLFNASSTRLLRFEGEEAATVVAVHGSTEVLDLGARVTLEGESVSATVMRTGRPARMTRYEDVPGSLAALVRVLGSRSAVGAPIAVGGRIWGVMVSGWTEPEPPLADAESRMAAFAELAATAIANAESRAELDKHVEQQAALRRVATLVAQGASPQDFFQAVVEEAGRMLPVGNALMARFEPDDTVTVVASRGAAEGFFPVGAQWPNVEGTNVASMVFQTGRSARIDDFSGATDPIGVAVRESGIKSAVGSPIVVKGRVWGLMSSASNEGPMPPDTEARLAAFTDLVATALDNAESRGELDKHVEQQAALRRVATLVAEGVPPRELFEAVVREVGTLLGGDFAGIARFEDDEVRTVGVWAADGEHPHTPRSWQMQPGDPATMIAEQRHPLRWNDWSAAPGPIAEFIRGMGIQSTVGTPVVVEGRLWGALALHSKQATPLPGDTEARMSQFTDLVGTAVANAQARTEVTRLAEEQAALRRLATLVAQGQPSREIIDAVASEVVELFGADLATVYRFDSDDEMTTLAATGRVASEIPLDSPLPVPPEGVTGKIRRTGRPARRDDYTGVSGTWGQLAENIGIRSVVGAPVTLEGNIWGVVGVASASDRPLPPDTEQRLAQFTDLVATAIANREARAQVDRLAEEQAALRRLATLVARGRPPAEIVEAVVTEVVGLLDMEIAVIYRFDTPDEITALAAAGPMAVRTPVGERMPLLPDGVTGRVLRTGRPARRDWHDDPSDLSGPWEDIVRDAQARSAVGAPITVEGRTWGVVAVADSREEALPLGTEERLAQFTDLVATAISNAESRFELAASRARVVTASAEERRRVVRDLHDGAQQRLVHTLISLKLAMRELDAADGQGARLVGEALEQAERANTELRELVHGILPAVLTSGGLRAGIGDLAARSSLPVRTEVTPQRFSSDLEANAYFVVSEALTNAIKHSSASRVHVTAHAEDGALLVEVRDDGVGGADARRGSGLIGLRDRVEAFEGTIVIASPRGGGTSLRVSFPIEVPATEEQAGAVEPV